VPWICFQQRHAVMSSNILAVSSLPVIPLPFEAATLEPVTALNCCSVLNCPMPVKHFSSDHVNSFKDVQTGPRLFRLIFFSSFFSFSHFSHCCVGLEVREDPEEFYKKFLPSAIDNLLFLGRRLQARFIRAIKVFKFHR